MTELDKEEDVHLFPFLSFQLSVGFCHTVTVSAHLLLTVLLNKRLAEGR